MITLELDDDVAVRLMTQLGDKIGKALGGPAGRGIPSGERAAKRTRVSNVDGVADDTLALIKKKFGTADFKRKSGLSNASTNRSLNRFIEEGKLERLARGAFRKLP